MNSKAERFVVRPGVVLLAFLISIPLHAQDSGAVLSGTVTDASGKAVPGARITIKNVATGQATETRTDSAGSYDALNLTPGAYELSVAAPGFSTGVTTVSITSGRQTMNFSHSARADRSRIARRGARGSSPPGRPQGPPYGRKVSQQITTDPISHRQLAPPGRRLPPDHVVVNWASELKR